MALPQFPKLEGERSTDVLILGGGLTGLLCAWYLQKAGISCLILEADRICSGTSGHTTAKITSQHGLCYSGYLRRMGKARARAYYEAQQRAIRAYGDLAETIDCDYKVLDNCIYSRHDSRVLEEEMAALEVLGIPAGLDTSLKLPFSTVGGIRFTEQAQIHPRKMAAGLISSLDICEHSRVLKIRGKRAFTDRGSVRGEKILVATHFPMLNRYGGYFLKQYQQRSYVMALQNGPQLDAMYLDAAGNGLSLRNHGDLLLLGGGGHRTGKQGGGWHALSEAAETYFPERRELCRWAAQDCMTLDAMPYIGRYSCLTPEIFVATGFHKWGMSNAMVSALVLCDLIQGKENPWAALFDPARPMEKDALLANIKESATNLLMPTRPRCTHLGCALKWNPQEHSWDCPCHGSRYSETGQVMDGPAVKRIRTE